MFMVLKKYLGNEKITNEDMNDLITELCKSLHFECEDDKCPIFDYVLNDDEKITAYESGECYLFESKDFIKKLKEVWKGDKDARL